MTARIAHANIQVSDIDASLAFYRHLGLVSVGCLRLDPVTLYYIAAPQDPNLTLELADNPTLESRSPGTGHVALVVEDLDKLLQRLAAVDIQPERPPYAPAPGRDLRVCFVQDPDGTRVELIDGDFPIPQDEPPEPGVALLGSQDD